MRLAALALPGLAAANDNGLAALPPMGWRSWNLYGNNVKQDLIESIMDGVAKKRTLPGGPSTPTSLCDLGYCDVGLDDNWQNCNGGSGGNHYHDADGNPVINYDRFPDMKAMVDHAHGLGLTAGWYGNNCDCSDHSSGDRKFYEGDAKALRKFGFDGYKLDGCGSQTDMQLWDDVFKGPADKGGGKPVMVENCHWGSKVPYEPTGPNEGCPWNFYRTSGDVRAKYSSVIGNLGTVHKFNSRNLSTPGCWAYPDMLEVGCQHGPGGSSDPGLTMAETRTHFGAWVIVSSPLTLSHDVNNDTLAAQLWPVIANTEVISVSQSYAGFSGGKFKESAKRVVLDTVNHAAMHRYMTEEERMATGPTVDASFQYLYKPMLPGGAKSAVLLLNQDTSAQDLTFSFADVPSLTCTTCLVRDIWNHKDLGSFSGSFTAAGVGAHDCAFLIVTPDPRVPTPPPTPSPPTPPPPVPGTLKNTGSGRCVDIYGGGNSPTYPANEAQAQLYACDTSKDNQKWEIQGTAITNPSSGKCLDINNHGNLPPEQAQDGQKVELYSCNSNWNQKWAMQKNGSTSVVVNTPSGKCLDAAGTADEAKLQLMTCSGGASQAWEFDAS